MCMNLSHNFKKKTQNGQNRSCDTIALKQRCVYKGCGPELTDPFNLLMS